MKIELLINATKVNGVLDGIEWETEYYGSPSKLTFTIAKYAELSFHEGAKVDLWVDDNHVFHGVVFEKSRDREHHIQVTAYDQLRYFANQHTWTYKNLRADQVLTQLCDDFELDKGEIENTSVVIPLRDEDNQTLFDIVETALDITYRTTKQEFILYDDAGVICLRNAEGWAVFDKVFDSSNVENFDYTTSIDKDTYTQIKVRQDSGEKGTKYVYVVDNTEAQDYWGLLRHVVDIDEGSNPINMAHMLMDIKCRPTRDLSLKGVQGHLKVRAGVKIPVTLRLGDKILDNVFCQCESVTHHFTADNHTMDVKLRDTAVRTIGETTTKVEN